MAGRDITEGGGIYDVTADIGIVSSGSLWSNTDVAYDVALGGLPFIYAINDARPYLRQTAPFRKDQFDNSSEPGEQSLSGWWMRSQVSFHAGSGIKFFNTQRSLSSVDSEYNRFQDSKGVNVWEQAEVSLLKSCTSGHEATAAIATNGTAQQHMRSIKWSTFTGALLHDGYDVDKIKVTDPSNPVHFIDYISGVGVYPVYAICDDGTNAYWVTNKTSGGTTKFTAYGKPLTGDSTSTADEFKIFDNAQVVSNALVEYVKQRLVICADNKVYECSTGAASTPTLVYTHPSLNHIYTGITASGPAIYISGYNGPQSTIEKFTLTSNGSMPVLTSASVAAEFPEGEIVHNIKYYLGYMMIGTNRGIRVAAVSDQDGSINYGPLIVETSQPCYDFASNDRYVWCATGVDGEPGLIRIDLGTELDTLRFAYANDVYYPGVTGHVTTACAFDGNTASGTSRVMFTTANNSSTDGAVYVEDATTLCATGYLTTGNIRFGTLEPKNFKRLLARGNFDNGTLTLETVAQDGTIYDHITYEAGVTAVEVGTTQPESPQEYVAYRFSFTRNADDATLGPVFKGYQVKATIATPRQRVIQFPVYCFDVETDRYNSLIGYEGRADARLRGLEAVEENGDVVIWQDLDTGESRQCVIEQITYSRMTPPDKRFDGQGGVIEIRIRTV